MYMCFSLKANLKNYEKQRKYSALDTCSHNNSCCNLGSRKREQEEKYGNRKQRSNRRELNNRINNELDSIGNDLDSTDVDSLDEDM